MRRAKVGMRVRPRATLVAADMIACMRKTGDLLRVGIVGTSFISEWFAGAAREAAGLLEPTAVYSRSASRAREFAGQQQLSGAFSDYGQMLGEVDVVYIASPTSAHFDQAMLAIERGKQVLVEKTATANLAQAERMFAAAAAQGVVVMEATRSLYTPAFAAIRAALPRLGQIRYAHFQKLQYSSRYDRFRAGEALNAFDPEMGNSALIDLGVYCIEPAIDLFGEPAAATGASVFLSNGFEAQGSLCLSYPAMIADIAYSKIVSGVGPSTIVGEAGGLEIDDIADTSRVVLRLRGEEPEVIFESAPVSPADTMQFELKAFADQVSAGEPDLRRQRVTLATRKLMDEHLATAR